MPLHVEAQARLLLVISLLILLSLLIKWGASRVLRVPPVVGYITLGLSLRLVSDAAGGLPEHGPFALEFLAQLGVAALLFKVGLRSDVVGLAQQLPRALRVGVLDVTVSGLLGLLVSRLLGWSWLTAAFVATAFSATSVGIATVVWEDAERLGTRLGQLLVDVAELDDLSAVFLLIVLLAVAPVVAAGGGAASLWQPALWTVLKLLVKLILFVALCFAFARYVEPRFTAWVASAERPPDRMLTIMGVGFGIAGLAGVLGSSVAVGALFAGLMFSRDAQAVHEEASFAPLYAFFTPFFFIDIGYAVDPRSLADSAVLGLLLFVPAAVGKLVGAGLPIARDRGLPAATLLGVSMLPRAEIALLVARIGNRVGPSVVPHAVYGGLVCMSALSVLVAPLVLDRLFRRWPPESHA